MVMKMIMWMMILLMITMQEWEALTGQLVTDVRTEATEVKDTLPKWIDEERATSVQLLKVC